MQLGRSVIAGVLLALFPALALGQVLDISEVNADDENGYPLLLDEVVTVRGVVTVGTGLLASNNDIYIQDATGGVNVIQMPGADPVVAPGDSVEVTGMVSWDLSSGSRRKTYIEVDTSDVPEAEIALISTGNAPPEPAVLTPRMLAEPGGEEYEGTYAVLRQVHLLVQIPPDEWPDDACSVDQASQVADADTSCRIWFDADTDICGTPAPLDTFDVYGVVVPRLRSVSSWRGHGILPPSRAHILSRGPGSGFAESGVDRVFANQTVELSFDIRGEADTLTRVSIQMPSGWSFSGDPSDVGLSGEGLASATVVEDSTDTGLVTIAGAALTVDARGTVELSNVDTPDAAGDFTFVFWTATAGTELAPILESPEITVGFLAEPGSILISEVYAHSDESQDTKDKAEFIELVNPSEDTVDVSGWVLSDLSNAGACGGTNIWEFPTVPPIRLEPGERVVVTKDAYRSEGPRSYGFLKVFKDSLAPNSIRLYEMVDLDYNDSDWEGGSGEVTWDDVPNMVLVSQADGDPTTSQEIRLLGGFDGNGARSPARLPGAEAVYLYSDRTLTQLVDAMEYRDPVHFQTDHCPNTEGLGGSDDAYVGLPPENYSLVRDASAEDTDDSGVDFSLSSWPTPGGGNVLGDGKPPALKTINKQADDVSLYVLLEFNEPLDAEDAVQVSNYSINAPGSLEELSVNGAWVTRDGKTVLLATDQQVPDETYDIRITGLRDASGNLMGDYQGEFDGGSTVATPIGEVQAWDENGFSPLWGEPAAVVGFATVEPGVFQPDRVNIYVQDPDDWGVNVYSSDLMPYPAMVGDLLLCTGRVLEYRSVDSSDPMAPAAGATTEIASGSDNDGTIAVLARGFDVVEPAVLRTGEIGSERREGTLVRTAGTVVSVEGFAIYIDDGSGACQVYQNFTDLDFSSYSLGDSLDVTGLVLQYDYTIPYLGGYELAPRYGTDIVNFGGGAIRSPKLSVSANVLDKRTRESVEIRFFSSGCDHVSVRIFDLKGRSIATVYDGKCKGTVTRSWDGKDDDGRDVPFGVYICHMQADARGGEDVGESAVPIVVGTKLN